LCKVSAAVINDFSLGPGLASIVNSEKASELNKKATKVVVNSKNTDNVLVLHLEGLTVIF